jgi:hypothetical protein
MDTCPSEPLFPLWLIGRTCGFESRQEQQGARESEGEVEARRITRSEGRLVAQER